MALPTITPADLHIVQLSPKLRRILKQRAARANQREYAPVLAADRAAFGEANRNFRTEAGAARGASQMVEGALTKSLAGLKGSGLTGGYLKQVKNEISSRQGDTAASIPFLIADAREARNSALGEARQNFRTDRAAMLQGTAADFNSMLESARSSGSTVEKEREGRARSKREDEADEQKTKEEEQGEGKYDPLNLENAQLALKTALSKWAKNPTVEVDGEERKLKEINPLQTPAQWRDFAAELDKEFSGFGLAEINAVIQRYLQRTEPERVAGVVQRATNF